MADLYSAAGGGAGTMAMVRGDGSGPKAGGSAALADDAAYSTREVTRRLLGYIRPHALLLVAAFVAAIVTVVLQLYVPILIGQCIDTLLGAGAVDFDRLAPLVVRLCVVTLLAAATQWLVGVCTNRLSYETVRDLRSDAYGTLRHMPFSLLDSHAHGDLLSRVVNDTDQVGDGLVQGFYQLLTGVVTIVGSFAFMFSISVPVGLIVLVVTPLSMLAASLLARISSKSFADAQRLQGSLVGYAEEMITNHRLVSVFGRAQASQAEFEHINAQLCVAGERSQFVSSLSNPTTRMVNNLNYALVAIVGCVCVVSGWPSTLTVGQVQSFLSYANQCMKPFNDISGVLTSLQAAFASARRIFSLVDTPHEPATEQAVGLPAPTKGDIVFSHVGFGYVAERPILRDISFHVRPGQRYALVGATGCGKTTLINLLMRFYDPDEGVIMVDGQPTRRVERTCLREAFGMVLQETWLLDGTIKENIAYGRPHATDEQIQSAAKRAHAHAFIQQMPQGYDTPVGEDGGVLSQGQRQLLCIARVMLADPAILLLDEATSSIDTRTELQVQDAFDRMMQGRTSLVVAHRLSTVRDADCILVMDAGHIIERGTHNELLAQGGFYAKLYESQWSQS